MRTLLSILILTFCTLSNSKGQLNCGNTIPFVTSYTYNDFFDSLHTNIDTLVNYGCNADPDHPVWFDLFVCQSGNAVLELNGSGSALDVDFVIWGPFVNGNYCGTSLLPVVDCGFSTSGIETIDIPSAITGEHYKLVVTTKFDGNYGEYFLYQTGGTAIFQDSVSCEFPIDTACSSYLAHQICHVTTDLSINKNVIVWNKDLTYPFVNYVVLKETTAMGVYDTVIVIAPGDTSAQIDSLTNPMIHSDLYKLCVTDTCGNLHCSSPHRNIHLQTTSSMLGYPQLNWNQYNGFYYPTYFIYRGTSLTTLTLYDSLSASSTAYTDYTPITGMNYYSVAVKPPVPCSPTRASAVNAYSNLANVNYIGIEEIENSFNVAVYPNPSNGQFTIEFSKPDDYQVTITDISGKLILTKMITSNRADQLDIGKLENGNYLLTFKNADSFCTRRITILK